MTSRARAEFPLRHAMERPRVLQTLGETPHDDRFPRVQKGTQSMNQRKRAHKYGVTKRANWMRSLA